MTLVSAILTLLSSIPELIRMIRSFSSWIDEQGGKQYLADVADAFEKLNLAKTTEEKYASAKAISHLISRVQP